jgi:hypothetical protein
MIRSGDEVILIKDFVATDAYAVFGSQTVGDPRVRYH